MDLHEALYTTRMMRGMRPDPIPVDVQARILDAAVRAPNGANAQNWHFVAVDDQETKEQIKKLYQEGRELEYQEFVHGDMATSIHGEEHQRDTMRGIKRSGDRFMEHFSEIPLMLFVFAIRDHGGANIYPAVWSTLLAARAEGVGGVLTTILRYRADAVHELLEVPADQGWGMTAMIALGYPTGRWGLAPRRPVHEVSSRNRWGRPFGVEVPEPLWP